MLYLPIKTDSISWYQIFLVSQELKKNCDFCLGPNIVPGIQVVLPISNKGFVP